MNILEKFIKKANTRHGNKYDYSKVEYINSKSKVTIICPEHGEFYQPPGKHVFGWGCKKCGINKRAKFRTKNTTTFIEEANKVHNFKFDYSEVKYINGKKKVNIKCKKGHEFEQTPNSHLRGIGCPICKGNKIRITQNEFIERLLNVHHDLYDFSKVQYKTFREKVNVVCKEHGDFKIKAASLLEGQGCPKCKYWKSESKLYKRILKTFPNEIIKRQGSPSWLGKQKFDIYFMEHNIAIEYNGQQHYEPVEIFGGKNRYIKQIEQDLDKMKKSIANNCLLFVIPYFYKEKEIEETIERIKQKIYERKRNS
jgi:Zn finger protein HypA/HybF involved in hydrogenase expression